MTLEQRIEQVRRQPPPPNERSAQAQVVQPILAHLGWPSEDPANVRFEHPAGRGRVDIALRLGGRDVAYFETKAPGKDLGGHVAQVLGYAFHGGVDICVLTTGLEWWFYLPREKGPPENRRFEALRMTEGSARTCADVLRRYLGRDALASGSAERDAKRALEELHTEKRLAKEIPEVWEKMKKGDDELLELIAKRVKERSGLNAMPAQVAIALGMKERRKPKLAPRRRRGERPTGNAAALQEEVADLRKEQETWREKRDQARKASDQEAQAEAQRRLRNISSRISARNRKLMGLGVQPSPTVAPQSVPPKLPPKRRRFPRPTSFRLWGHETPVKTWGAVLVGVFKAVAERHSHQFLDTARPLWGNRKPWVSADPGDLHTPRPLGQSGFHVEANLSAKDIRNRCRRLLAAFDHPATDLEVTLHQGWPPGDTP